MNKPVTAMGRHELLERIAELEAETARWVRRVQELEERNIQARAVLAGGKP